MKSLKDIQKIVTKFNVKPGPEMRGKVLDEALELQRNQNQQSIPGTYIWRIIMKSKITKLAAAAVIIIAVVIGITIFDKAVTPAYGITDLPKLLQAAKTLHYKAWSYFPEDTGPGKVQRRVALENWYDFENGFYRTMSEGYDNVPENTSLVLVENVCDGQYLMSINHSKKSVTFKELSPFQQKLDNYQNIHEFTTKILGNAKRFDDFKMVGEEIIDGVQYDIWQGQTEFPLFHELLRAKSWISPTTGNIARIEIGGDIPCYEIQKVERNVDISPDIFATEPPQGYTLLNTKETAENPVLQYNFCSQDSLMVAINITFSLPDGSVVMAWHSEDTQSNASQAFLFENLKAGGSLPKLPIELYSLKSMGGGVSLTYNGRHLLYTTKAGKFYEWSIYVPAQTPPSRSDFVGYFPIPRFNPPKDRVTFSFGSLPDVPIENEQDFNTWVLGAMTELNDDGKDVKSLTYQDVLQLAQKIHHLPPQ